MLKSNSILNSSVLATLGGFVLIAAAVATSGSFDTTTKVGKKGDRFAAVGAEICSTESWPNISAECVAWKNGDPAKDVRYITMSSTDAAARSTTLTRVAVSN